MAEVKMKLEGSQGAVETVENTVKNNKLEMDEWVKICKMNKNIKTNSSEKTWESQRRLLYSLFFILKKKHNETANI